MAKSRSRQVHPRLVRRGDIVLVKGDHDGRTEVVRAVSVVLHLANGQDVVYTMDEQVEIAPAEDGGPTPEAIAEAAKADAEVRTEEGVTRSPRPASGRKIQ